MIAPQAPPEAGRPSELEALRRRLAELERSNAELTEFAFAASHELQSPLRKLLGFSEVLKTRLAGRDPESADLAARLARSAARLSRLADDLLALARASDDLDAPLESVSLDALLDQVLEELAGEAASADAAVERRPLPRLAADAAQLRRLLRGLLANALKYRAEGRRPVLRVYSRPAAPGFAEIVVEDNGLGVPPGQSRRLFRPFERLHEGQAREGSGLGLLLCRKIAVRHGGWIAFERPQGPGARFVLTLPTRFLSLEEP